VALAASPDPASRKRRREGEASAALSLADPADGLSLISPDAHHLEDVVMAMARQLVQEADPADPSDAEGSAGPGAPDRAFARASSLGESVGQRLGGTALAPATRDRVLRAVLQLALPPWARAGQGEPTAPSAGPGDAPGPGLGPLHAGGFNVLAGFLRGFAGACVRRDAEGLVEFGHAVVDAANRLSLDRLHARLRPKPTIRDYCAYGGPLQLACQALPAGHPDAGPVTPFVARVLRHLLSNGPAGVVGRARSACLERLLASLAWLPLWLRASRSPYLDDVTRAVALLARDEADLDLQCVGTGLALALGGLCCEAMHVRVLAVLGMNCPPSTQAGRLGEVAVAYLGHATREPQAFAATLRRVAILDAHTAGRIVFRVAVAEARRGLWRSDPGVQPAASRLRLCLQSALRLDPQRQRAVLQGLLGATHHLRGLNGAFERQDQGMGQLLDTMLTDMGPDGVALRPVVTDVLRLVRDPQQAFQLAHRRGEAPYVPLYIAQALATYLPLASQRFLSDAVRFLLADKNRLQGSWHLLLRLVTDHPSGVTPARLPVVRAQLLDGLAAYRAQRPGPARPDAAHATAVHGIVKALQSLYAHPLLRAKLDVQAEIAALEAFHDPRALQPVVAFLRASFPISTLKGAQ